MYKAIDYISIGTDGNSPYQKYISPYDYDDMIQDLEAEAEAKRKNDMDFAYYDITEGNDEYNSVMTYYTLYEGYTSEEFIEEMEARGLKKPI